MMSPALTVRDAAKLLSVHPETIRRAIARGKLAAARLGRTIRISPRDLDIYYRVQAAANGREAAPRSGSTPPGINREGTPRGA